MEAPNSLRFYILFYFGNFISQRLIKMGRSTSTGADGTNLLELESISVQKVLNYGNTDISLIINCSALHRVPFFQLVMLFGMRVWNRLHIWLKLWNQKGVSDFPACIRTNKAWNTWGCGMWKLPLLASTTIVLIHLCSVLLKPFLKILLDSVENRALHMWIPDLLALHCFPSSHILDPTQYHLYDLKYTTVQGSFCWLWKPPITLLTTCFSRLVRWY